MNVADLFASSSSWASALDAVLKSTVLIAATGVAAVLLRRASAAARHCVWTLGLSGALILPALSFALPRWEVSVVTLDAPQTSDSALEKRGASAFARGAPADRRSLGRGWSAPRQGREQPGLLGSESNLRTFAPETAIFAIWLAGVLAILARLIVGVIAVQFMSRRTPVVTDAPWLPLARRLAHEIGIGPNLRFLRSHRATMPMAWGILRSSVLMPADADAWDAGRLRIVLLHELAHVKRRDCLTHVLSQIACAVYWFNPLVWVAAKRARAERERACDDLVLAAGTRGSDYADQLLEMARARRDGRFPVLLTGATLAMAHRTQLEGRLIAILDPRVPRSRLSRTAIAGAAAVAACAMVPLATIQPWAYTEPAPAEAAAAFSLDRSEARRGQRESAADVPRSIDPARLPAADVASAITAATLDAGVQGSTAEVLESAMEGALRGAWDGVLGALTAQAQPAQGARPTQPAQPAQPTAGSEEREADPRTIAALTAALKDPDVDVREAAMHALVQLRDPAIYETLVAALHDSSADIREQAASALSELRDPRAVEPLKGALKDRSADVREQVVFALGQLRDKETAAAIAEALKDESADVREQAAFALGQLRDKASLDALAAALQDSSASVREQAAFALGEIGDTRAMHALAAALTDAADDVREQAVFALGQLGDPAAVDGLVKALRDAEPGIREQAAFALGQIGEARAVSALISALKDSDAEVRAQAAFSLGQLGDPAAVEPLVIAMKDANADVRSQAAFALAQLRDPRAIDALTAALKDSNAEVRRHAAFALGQLHR